MLSGLVIWVVDAAQGGIKDWTQRWPAPRPGMDVAGLKGFFEGMEAQHDAIMHGTSHICPSPPCLKPPFIFPS